MIKNFRVQYCPCCQSQNFVNTYINKNPKKISNYNDFFYGSSNFIKNIYKCCKCSYGFIGDIEPEYRKYYELQDVYERLDMDSYRVSYFKGIKENLLSRFPNLNHDIDVLDVGCANGLWLDQWSDVGKLYGIEYSKSHIQNLATKNISVLQLSDIKNKSFDLITMFDVLEHLENPYDYLCHISKFLKRNGILVIVVPDMGKWLARVLKYKYYLVCPMHFSYFNSKSIKSFLERFFLKHNIWIEKSPPMRANIAGVLRWISPIRNIPMWLNFTFPIPYRAGLICFAKNI